MKSSKIAQSITPCSLVLAVFPVAFLCLPEGVPFVYAACGGGLTSAVNNMQAFSQTVRYDNFPNNEVAGTVSSSTLDNSSNGCEFKVSVSFTIYTAPWPLTDCNAAKARECSSSPCNPSDVTFAYGAGSHSLTQYTNQCNSSSDTNTIDVYLTGCDTTGNLLFSGDAASTPCN